MQIFASDLCFMKNIQELDEREHNVGLSEGSHSENVDENGNFSIQVLSQALHRYFGIVLEPVSKSEGAEERLRADGYIIHSDGHWIAYRRRRLANNRENAFWNLNSMLHRPEPISEFHLQALLLSPEVNSYAAVGDLPPYSDSATIGSRGAWHAETALLPQHSRSASASSAPLPAPTTSMFTGPAHRLGDANPAAIPVDAEEFMTEEEREEMEIAKAISLSLAEQHTHNNNSSSSASTTRDDSATSSLASAQAISASAAADQRERIRQLRVAALSKPSQ